MTPVSPTPPSHPLAKPDFQPPESDRGEKPSEKQGFFNGLLVDTRGRALQLTLVPGNLADVKAAEQIWAPAGKRVVADKGYDSNPFREALMAESATTSIPPRSNRTSPPPFHRGYYRLRHQVENFFQRIKRWRAVGTRYDKLDLHFLASIQLVAILDWLDVTSPK